MRLTVLAIALALCPALAHGAGYYNMPTSWQQCLGVGFGPGYHAPLLLGPKMTAPIASQRIHRLPGPLPPPPRGAGFAGPTCLDCGFGSHPVAYGSSAAYEHEAPFEPYAAPTYTEIATPPVFAGPSLGAPKPDRKAEQVPGPTAD